MCCDWPGILTDFLANMQGREFSQSSREAPGTFVLKLLFPRGTELLDAIGALSLVFPVLSEGWKGLNFRLRRPGRR